LFVAGSVSLITLRAERIQGPLPTAVSDLSQANTLEVKNEADQVVLHGTFATIEDKGAELEREAALSASAGVSGQGKAEIEVSRKNGAVSKQEIELSLKSLIPNTSYKLFIDTNQVATFKSNGEGEADLKFSSK